MIDVVEKITEEIEIMAGSAISKGRHRRHAHKDRGGKDRDQCWHFDGCGVAKRGWHAS